MNNIDEKLSSIDATINAAKARRKNRSEDGEPVKRVRKTPEERELLARQKEEIRVAKKAARDAKNVGKVVHMAKVEKAKSKLPLLDDAAESFLSEAVSNLSQEQIDALAQHLLHFNRTMATQRSLETKIVEGMTVIVKSGRYVGQTGVVSKAQRIRCYVDIAGKELYLFCSDVEEVSATVASKSA